MTQTFPWDQVITGVLTFAASGGLAWWLDKRKENMNKKEKVKELYKSIVDALSSTSDKDQLTADDFDSFIRENRHHFEGNFKRILPQSFDGSWVNHRLSSLNNKVWYTNIFRNLEGREVHSTTNEKISENYYYFRSEKSKLTWENVANEALRRYNKLTNDDILVIEWMLEIIPGQPSMKE